MVNKNIRYSTSLKCKHWAIKHVPQQFAQYHKSIERTRVKCVGCVGVGGGEGGILFLLFLIFLCFQMKTERTYIAWNFSNVNLITAVTF